MNKADRTYWRWTLINKYPGLKDLEQFGRVEREIHRLEEKGVDIRGSSEAGIIGASVMQEGPVRMFDAACKSIFHNRPPDGIDSETALMDAILDPEVDNPQLHVQKRIEAQQEAIRLVRSKVEASPEHQRVIDEDAELEKILSGHDEE